MLTRDRDITKTLSVIHALAGGAAGGVIVRRQLMDARGCIASGSPAISSISEVRQSSQRRRSRLSAGPDSPARDCGPDGGNGQVRHDPRAPSDTPFGIPPAVSLDDRSLGPHNEATRNEATRLRADPGQKQDPEKVTIYAPMSSMFLRLGAGAPPRQAHPSRAARARTLP
jgi:hypothetical protein